MKLKRLEMTAEAVLVRQEKIRRTGVDKIGSAKRQICSNNELRKLEKDIIAKEALGVSLDDNVLLNTVIEKWLITKQDIASTSKMVYELNYLRQIKNSKIGQMKITKIKKTDILYFLKTLSEEKHLKGSTVNTIFTVVTQSMQLAYEDGLIMRNPCSGIKITNKTSNSERPTLTTEQEEELLYRIQNSSRSKKIYPLVGILLNTGLRIGEAVGLTWDDVDIENGFIDINKQIVSLKNKDSGKYELIVKAPKSESGTRRIYMTDFVKDLFVLQKEISDNANSNVSVDNYSNFVFTSNRGKNLCVRSFEYALGYISEVKNEGRDVILPRVTPHILRHTACTKMINAGMNINAVQTIMGHSNVDITLQIYTHINEKQLRDEMKKLQNISEKVDTF